MQLVILTAARENAGRRVRLMVLTASVGHWRAEREEKWAWREFCLESCAVGKATSPFPRCGVAATLRLQLNASEGPPGRAKRATRRSERVSDARARRAVWTGWARCEGGRGLAGTGMALLLKKAVGRVFVMGDCQAVRHSHRTTRALDMQVPRNDESPGHKPIPLHQ